MEDNPCADCFRALLRPRAEDPLKATKKDDDLWGGMERGACMERGGAWGVMHPPSPHEMHPPLAAFAAPLPYSPTGAQYAPAQYHHAQHTSSGQNMVSPSNYYGVYVHHGYHRHRGGATHEPGGAGAVPPQHYSTGFQPHSQAHYYPHPHHRAAGGGAQYSPPGGYPSPYGGGGGQTSPPRSPKGPKPATPSEPEQAWPRLPRVESPPVPMQQVEQHGSQSHLAPAHLGPRTSSGLQSMMGSTSTKMDFDDEPHAGPGTPTPADSDTERDPNGEYEGDFDAKPGSSFGEALFAWGPPQPSRLQPRKASPPPTPMETPVLPNATDLGGLLSATWVEVPYDELQLLDIIGEGAFGKVHKAKWRGATVAVKALSTDGNGGAMRGTPLEEFQKELVTMAAVPDHPHVLGLLGASTVPPQFAIVTPYCARGSLYALLHSPVDFLTWTQIVHVALGAAQGMLHLHTHGILHRDLKSANLLCDSNLDVKVADFGLSRNISENTMTGGLGTFQWMAPEVLGHQRYSERADVYSFAIVLWECVARKLPYADMNGWQAAMAVMTRGLRPTMPPGTPPPLAALIQACWAAVPTDRPLFPHIVEQLERFLDQLEGRTTRPHQPLPSAV